jgi:hypothetical protein
LRLARDELPIPSQGTFILFSLFIPKIFRNDFESSGPINVVLTDLYIYETKVAPGGWLGGGIEEFQTFVFFLFDFRVECFLAADCNQIAVDSMPRVTAFNFSLHIFSFGFPSSKDQLEASVV